MNFDWACIYSDDKATKNKGHQYRNGSLDINQKQQFDLKTSFYLLNNFPDIPVINGQWIDSIQRYAIGASQILPTDGRTSYLTFIIFLSEDEIYEINNILPILKWLTNSPIVLKEFSDASQSIKINIVANDFVNRKTNMLIEDSLTLINYLCDNYSKRDTSYKLIIQENYSNIHTYIFFLHNLWQLLIPSLRKDFSWGWAVNSTDIAYKKSFKVFFISGKKSKLLTGVESRVFEVQENISDLSKGYINFIQSKNDFLSDENLIKKYKGNFNQLYLLQNFYYHLYSLESASIDDLTAQILGVCNLITSLNIIYKNDLIELDYYEKLYNNFNLYLENIIPKIFETSQFKRIFAEDSPSISEKNINLILTKFKDLIENQGNIDKAILAHGLKFKWVEDLILRMIDLIDIKNSCSFIFIFKSLHSSLSKDRLDFFFKVIISLKDILTTKVIDETRLKSDFWLSIFNTYPFDYKILDEYNWMSLSIVIRIFYLTNIEDYQYKIKILNEIFILIDRIPNEFLKQYFEIILNFFNEIDFLKYYIQLDKNYFLDEFLSLIYRNYIWLFQQDLSFKNLDIILKILPLLNKDEKTIVLNQDYFDNLIMFLLKYNKINNMTFVLENFRDINNLHFYNLNIYNRKILWSLSYSKSYLRSTTIECIKSLKQIDIIEKALFDDLNIFLSSNNNLVLSNNLANYLKDENIIYSLSCSVVFNYIFKFMNEEAKARYLNNVKQKPKFMENILSVLKFDSKSNFKEPRPYQPISLINHLNIEARLDLCFPDRLDELNLSKIEWKRSFINCLSDLANNRHDLDIISREAMIDLSRIPQADTIYNYTSNIAKTVFDDRLTPVNLFFLAIKNHFSIQENFDYKSEYTKYKLIFMLMRYYLLKLSI